MDEPEGTIPVFVNRSAGSAAGAAESIASALAREGVGAAVREVEPGTLAAAIANEVASGTRIVGVAGGDGSLSTAASALAGTGVVLAPFPGGTLNHFARRLALGDVDAAARALAVCRTSPVPIGRVGDRVFINNASCGFYPHLVRHRERLRPWLGKWPAAAVAAVQVFLGHRRMRLRMDTPEGSFDRRVSAVWVGLGKGSFRLPGEEGPDRDASVLEIVLPHASSRARLLGLAGRVLWRLARRRRPRTAGLEILHAPSFTLESRRPLDVALDGEPFRIPAPLHFRIEPEGLRVVVGEDAQEQSAPPR